MICDFCMQFKQTGDCELGLNIPKTMGCIGFDPGIEKFCSDPKDFVSSRQIVEMAMYFKLKGRELKKVRLMAARIEAALVTG